MRFYNKQHKYYCGIDLHAKSMYMCIQDQNGKVLVHKNIRTSPEYFLKVIKPYREDLIVIKTLSKNMGKEKHYLYWLLNWDERFISF